MTQIRRFFSGADLSKIRQIRVIRVFRVPYQTAISQIAQKWPTLPPMTNKCQMAWW